MSLLLLFVRRLQDWLPTRWFPNQAQNADGSVPRKYALLSGFAAAFAQVWNQLQYARAQTRLSTSTDGFLDLGIYDYAGNALPRHPGEIDSTYWARVKPQLLPKANTRPNILAALEALTGAPARLIEPWDPRDTFCFDHSFLDVDGEDSPGQLTNPGDRYQGFVQCSLPIVAGTQGAPPEVCLDGTDYFDTAGILGAPALFLWDAPPVGSGGATLVYALINRLKVFGVTVWVQFLPVGEPDLRLSYAVLTDDFGDPLTDDSGNPLLDA